MNIYVALIRGIGPGNPNMTGEKFRVFFEELGFTEVQAVLASGNIIFASTDSDTDALAGRIQGALPQKLGYNRGVIIRSQIELQNLIDRDPFQGHEESHNKGVYHLITFFKNSPDIPFRLPHTPDGKPYTLLGKIDKAIYGTIDLSKGKTPDYMAWMEKQFGKDITSRTPKTIRLILSRMNKAQL